MSLTIRFNLVEIAVGVEEFCWHFRDIFIWRSFWCVKGLLFGGRYCEMLLS